jgi:chromosome segregation ATPase
MVSLEQVKLLESKVIKALEYIDQVTKENTHLRKKLESYQKRIDGLEVVVQRFKDDQGLIEEGILSALSRLNRFEAEIEKNLAPEEFQEDSPVEARRTEAGDPPESPKGKEESDKAAGRSVSHDFSSLEAEGEMGNGLILEPETDDLPGDEEISDETLNPGELDIF